MSESTVLTIRKHADQTGQQRVVRFDCDTGEKKLVNPATPGDAHESWPLAGISFADPAGNHADPPALTTISSGKLAEGLAEGWATATGARPVVRPAGPTMEDWNSGQTGQPHMFMHYDTVTFHTLDGDFTYNVTHQPDKYADHDEATYEIAAFDADDTTEVTPEIYEAGATRVDDYYTLALEG